MAFGPGETPPAVQETTAPTEAELFRLMLTELSRIRRGIELLINQDVKEEDVT